MYRVCAIYFSPTGHTKRMVLTAAKAAAAALSAMPGGAEMEILDLTAPAPRQQPRTFGPTDVVFLGVPTYAGRVPNKLLPDLQAQIHGAGAVGVPLVTYGGRSFDDALAELGDLMEGAGFALVGAGAFVCQHAFAPGVAAGRPDAGDLKKAVALGTGAADRIRRGGRIRSADLPGSHPAGPYYVPKGLDGQPARFLHAKPVRDAARCIECGRCAAGCPMGSISAEDFVTNGTCIKCQRCIQRCPAGARALEDAAFQSHRAMLEARFGGRQSESCIYL